MFWICTYNSDDKIKHFLLLLSRVSTEPRPLLLLTHTTRRRLGIQKELGEDRTLSVQLASVDSRGIPHPVVSCSIYKAGWRRRNQGEGYLSSEVTVMHDGTLLSWRWLITCLPLGRVKEFFVLFRLYVSFALPIKLLFYQPIRFFTSILLIFSLILLEREWTSSCTVLSCLLGLTHTYEVLKPVISFFNTLIYLSLKKPSMKLFTNSVIYSTSPSF